MKKVFAGMTEDVRYRTVLPGFDMLNSTDSFRKKREKFSFNQKGTYFARLIQRTEMIKSARKDFSTFFWYNNFNDEGLNSWIKRQEKYS
jgi:hypothetical protein